MGNYRRMSWDYRVIIVVPAASKAIADAAARHIDPAQPSAEVECFSMRLSASGAEPPTHFGTYTSATEEIVQEMASMLPQISGVMFWRHGVGGDLQASNVTDPTGQPWGWQESMAAAGLVRILPPLE